MQRKQPHKWKAEATAHFLEAAVELADGGDLFPHKMRRYSCSLIRGKMVEKGSPEVSIDVVLSKFNTFLADWRGYSELKLKPGSCFNPVTATFDAPQDWWDELSNKKLKKFRKGIPHMEELDKIFRHMESPSLCYQCGSNSHSSSTRKTDLGYHHSESSEQLSLSRGVPGYLDLLDELEQDGVNRNCDDYVTAVNLLRCPQLRTVYSRIKSIDEKVTMLRKLREQMVDFGVRRRGCGGGPFFPEESFASWGAYGRALLETAPRLRDRLTARSAADTELHAVRGRSGADMKRTLNWWDLAWFGVGAVIGAGIFVLTGQEAKEAAGPAVVLSYAVSGVSAMLSVFCYTEFAIEIPVAGGSFAYLRVELGDFMAFIAAGNILLEYCIGGAAVARSWTSYFATLLNHHPNDFRIHAASLSEDYSRLDPIAVVVITLICVLAVFSTKGSSRLNYVLSIVHFAVIIFIIAAGLSRAKLSNLTADFAPYGARGIFAASAVLFFAYIGFDAVSTMAEETKNPAKDIPVGLVGAMSLTTVVYCVLAVTLCLMQPYREIDADAPFTVAFTAVGMDWAKYIVAFGALKGMTTVLLVSAVGQARYLTHIARTHMVPPCLAQVHPTWGTPVYATIVMLSATAVIALFTDLGILSNLLSISTLFIFMLVAVALLVRRYYVSGETTASDRNKLVACVAVIIASSVVTAAYWGLATGGWAAYAATVPAWFAATLFLQLGVPKARVPKMWGVPLVPWLPSASIFINIFLLGSIDGKSFMRFGIWTAALLAYYFFIGLHASYDTAKALAAEAAAGKVEEGGARKTVDGGDGGGN